MKRLSWLLTIPLTAMAAIFAVANRQSVTVDLWPLETLIQLPLFLLVLGSLLVGLLAGALAAWISGRRTRRRLREARRSAAELENEVDRLRQAHAHETTDVTRQVRAEPAGHRALGLQ